MAVIFYITDKTIQDYNTPHFHVPPCLLSVLTLGEFIPIINGQNDISAKHPMSEGAT